MEETLSALGDAEREQLSASLQLLRDLLRGTA